MTTPDTLAARLRRAMENKPEASRVELSRSTVDALLRAVEGKEVTTLADAARIIQRQHYRDVADALSAADGKEGEDAVSAFLDVLVACHD